MKIVKYYEARLVINLRLLKVLAHFNFVNVSFHHQLREINTLTVNYKYSCSNTENLPLPVQMKLSEKLKTFSRFFIAFFESTLNFEHFEKKMSLTAQVFLKLLTPKDVFT